MPPPCKFHTTPHYQFILHDCTLIALTCPFWKNSKRYNNELNHQIIQIRLYRQYIIYHCSKQRSLEKIEGLHIIIIIMPLPVHLIMETCSSLAMQLYRSLNHMLHIIISRCCLKQIQINHSHNVQQNLNMSHLIIDSLPHDHFYACV